jgi:hypothetical protein
MTLRQHDLPARRRGESEPDRGSRLLLRAVDAQRRLDARRADGPLTKTHPVGPSDSRRANPPRSYRRGFA